MFLLLSESYLHSNNKDFAFSFVYYLFLIFSTLYPITVAAFSFLKVTAIILASLPLATLLAQEQTLKQSLLALSRY